jgi:hypothetical protein
MVDVRSARLRLGLLAALLGCVSLPAAARECPPWPGEPRPLPQLSDPDPLRARWAELRAAELVLRAERLEATAPVAAYQTWRRVLCVAPEDPVARAGAQRTRPLRLHRLAIAQGPASEPPPPDTDAWRTLDEPVQLAGRRPAPSAPLAPTPPGAAPQPAADARAEALRRVERRLATAERQVAAARFDEALANAARAREALAALAPGRDRARRQLRLELVEATAEAARGQDAAARACFVRALELDPAFALDARATSPKLLRLLDAARAERGGPQ